MLKIFLLILLAYCSLKAQSAQALCPHEILATERISKQKCAEYSKIMKKPLIFGRKPPCGWNYVPNCGEIGFKGMIVGGTEAALKEFPHMAALGWTNDDDTISYNCVGSLISDRFVLTVAHCLWYEGRRPDVVVLGDLDLASDEDMAPGVAHSTALRVPIKRLIKHEYYDGKKNDIALIELTREVFFNSSSFYRPACLQIDEFQFSEGTKVAATGWGRRKNVEKTSEKLMKVGLPLHNMSRCWSDLDDDDLSDESQMCAGGEEGKDTCYGDSGGPIQLPISKELKCVYSIIGLTSFGPYVCAKGQAAVYTKVSHFIDWIESNVWPTQYREWEARNRV